MNPTAYIIVGILVVLLGIIVWKRTEIWQALKAIRLPRFPFSSPAVTPISAPPPPTGSPPTGTGSKLEKDQILGSDALIKRNRILRVIFYVLSLLIFIGALPLAVAKLAEDWFRLGPWGIFVGLCVGIVLFFPKVHDKLIVKVETQRQFMTLDLLKAFFKSRNPYVTYGAGTHPAFPWERRLGRNNIALLEATENFSVEVITKTGVVTVRGSYRIRPRVDTMSAPAFLSGVAVVAEDLADLIKSKIIKQLAGKKLDDVSRQIKKLNDTLAIEFGTNTTVGHPTPEISEFEERFGIVVGDVTVGTIELSEDAKKTRNAVDEALQFAKGVALVLGYATPKAMQKAVEAGTLSAETVENARKQFLAVSDNIKMDVRDWTFNIKGFEHLTPETANALGQAARAYAASQRSQKGNP